MNNYPFLRILVVFAFIAVFSCSKKEDPIEINTQNLSLELTSSVEANDQLAVVLLDTPVTFKVMGSDGEDYTAKAKFFLNDEEIEGATYTFSTSGSFAVKAIYEGAISNIIDFQVLSENQRALTVDATRAMNNQLITFGLLDSDGNNTASEATFFVDSKAISGNTYSSATEGDFEVYAEYTVDGETFKSFIKDFSVYIPRRNVVLEDYTGTWCGYCLKALVAVDSAKVLTKGHVSIVAIHESSIGPPDPMAFPQVNDLQAEFDVPDSFPQTQLNRTVTWNATPPTSLIYDFDVVTSIAGVQTDLSVAINSSINGNTLSVDTKVVYRNGSEPGDKMVVYLLESGIIADQVNYFNKDKNSPYYGAGNPIKDFVHNDALRNSLSNLFGDPIPETAAFEEYKKTYTFAIPSTYKADNLSVVVMIVKADNSAKNSQYAHIGENKGFE